MNFKEFITEKLSKLSNAHHQSMGRLSHGRLHKDGGSKNFVAAYRKKESLRNNNSNPNKNKGSEKQISSFEAKKLAAGSNGKKVNLNNVGSAGKTLNGKTGVKLKKKNNKFFVKKK
jgi:hypothetical protein